MPVMQEKTPLYDLHVYMVGAEKPVVALERVTEGIVKSDEAKFAFVTDSHYSHNATAVIGSRRFVLQNVAYTKIVRSKNKVFNDAGSWVPPYWTDAFKEDENAGNGS